MRQRIIFLFLVILIVNIPAQADNIVPELFVKNDSEILKEMFTLNIGIMRFKENGKITAINPLDSDNAVNSIKNALDTVTVADLTKKDAVYKAVLSLKSKLGDTEKNKYDILERKISYSGGNIDNNLIYELFLELKKNQNYAGVSKTWFENYDNPFYMIKTGMPLERVFYDDRTVCEMKNSQNKAPLDMLISGEIEKVEKRYFISVYFYSYLKNKVVKTFSVVTDSENISLKINEKMEEIIPELFLIRYANLIINTEDDDTAIYLDSNYTGKKNVEIKYLPPKKYVVTLKKENYVDKNENIELVDNEKKFVFLQIDKMQDLQLINFYIEPLGTKIFINSVYQGKTPFKKALPKGDYIISSKSDLFENNRYYLAINDVTTEEKLLIFHLKSKDIRTNYNVKKALYYTSFWNFTFSFATSIAFTVFAIEYRIRGNYSEENQLSYSVFYGLAWGFGAYTVLSLGWLFFALADYLITKEKNDFIPILDFYKDAEGIDRLTMGAVIRL